MRIPSSQMAAIFAHAHRADPYECFGFLIGDFGSGGIVAAVRPGTNLNTTGQHIPDRYEMDPAEFVALERELEGQGQEIIGFYHSHPDDRPHPSSFDLERAWEAYFYLIVSVSDGQDGEVRVWVVDVDQGRFREEPLEIS